MKKRIYVCEAVVLFILLVMLSFSVQADPSIIVADYQLEPGEFMPGETGVLTVVLTNAETVATTTETRGDASHTVSVTETNGVVIDQIWISAVSDESGRQIRSLLGVNGYKDLGNLAAGASLTLSFEMIAEENISDGYYFPKLHIDLKDDMNGNYDDVVFPLELRVNNETLDIIPESVPSTISMSGATDISFSLINLRGSVLENIVITPQSSDDMTVYPEKIVLHQLTADEQQTIHFSLIPEQIGSENITFKVDYKNGGNSHTRSTSVSLEVVDSFDVAPIIYSMPSTIEKGSKETIKLKVYNAKADSISSVIITPITSARLTPSQYFIGSMDADDIYSLSFDVDTTGLNVNQTYDIGFTVSFKQDETTYVTPMIQSTFTVVSEGTNGDEAALVTGLFIVFLGVIIYFVYRWRKKQQLKKLMVNQS